MTTIGEQIEALDRAMAEATKSKPRKPSYFKFVRGTLAEDPIGHKVAMPWSNGRTLLGDVVGVYTAESPHGGTSVHLKVRHFNREAWPVDPLAASVEVIR